MQGAMAFVDGFRIKPCFLELSIHIACEDARSVGHTLGPALEQGKPCMRDHLAIKHQAMAIKPPSPLGCTPKRVRAGNVLEAHLRLAQCRVCLPKTVLAPKVRQAGIHAHACTSSNDERVSLLYQGGTLLKRILLCPRQRITHWPVL